MSFQTPGDPSLKFGRIVLISSSSTPNRKSLSFLIEHFPSTIAASNLLAQLRYSQDPILISLKNALLKISRLDIFSQYLSAIPSQLVIVDSTMLYSVATSFTFENVCYFFALPVDNVWS